MKTSQKVLMLYLLVGVMFIMGSILDLELLTTISTVLLVPVLIVYYRYKAQKWFLAMVVVLLLFYLRDLFMLQDFNLNLQPVIWLFGAAVFIIYIFALTSLQSSKVHLVEVFSLLIMYGFLAFLFFTIAELVPQVVPSYKVVAYTYLLLLTLLLALTFTQYLIKSHYASLWLMLASASLLVSELSLFFQVYVVSDISVTVFYPLFHVLAYYALIEHALHRRESLRIPGF